ncbi:hypothetical protein Unana1_04613 [Umbelopsis nana]
MVLLPTFLVVLDIASFVLGASISNRSNGGKSFTVPLRRQMSYKANSLRADLTKRADGSAQATNFATHYIISLGVGQPETQYNLIVDTGSSNTWVGAGAKYVVTSTSKPTDHSFAITYGSGSVKGNEVVDTVTVSAGLKITSQELGIANQSVGFDGLDGIFGLGPTDLTAGTVDGVASVPTVLDNLFSEGAIPSNEFSLSFEPTVSGSEMNGVITFGGTDSSKFTGALSYVPIVQTSPADNF